MRTARPSRKLAIETGRSRNSCAAGSTPDAQCTVRRRGGEGKQRDASRFAGPRRRERHSARSAPYLLQIAAPPRVEACLAFAPVPSRPCSTATIAALARNVVVVPDVRDLATGRPTRSLRTCRATARSLRRPSGRAHRACSHHSSDAMQSAERTGWPLWSLSPSRSVNVY